MLEQLLKEGEWLPIEQAPEYPQIILAKYHDGTLALAVKSEWMMPLGYSEFMHIPAYYEHEDLNNKMIDEYNERLCND